MLINVKAFPSSKKEEIISKGESGFDVFVREKPINGEANRAITRVLSQYFNVPDSEAKLVKGFRQRNKIFSIRDDLIKKQSAPPSKPVRKP
ncbi:MAG: DUF167 domain-containing protein [Candidatus Paceibacterota bacterium]